MTARETSPLLPKPRDSTPPPPPSSSSSPEWSSSPASLVFRVVFTAFLVTTSFSVTQVPMIYVFGVMTCDEYYKTHTDPGSGTPGRCRLPEIDARTAREVALLGVGTTFFGVVNLFFTGWMIKKSGVKVALLTSVFWPAVRLLMQNVGVELGAATGILIIQASQIITVVGGPAGYLLALNSFATEIVKPAERTATLGKVSGCAMFGTAAGYLFGGLLSDAFGIAAPFRVTLALFLISCLYVLIFLPRVESNLSPESQKKASSLSAFFAPLRLYVPSRWVLKDGRARHEYGVLLLGLGAFLGVLATGYQSTLLQMFSTDALDFGTTENGWLVSLNGLVRGIFLTFMFPGIISRGRKWLDRRKNYKCSELSPGSETVTAIPSVPPQPAEFEPAPLEGADPQQPTEPPPLHPAEQVESFHFDLLFTTYSILLDGILTGLATFVATGPQLYMLAVILPFASGTGPAAKGTIMQMCSPSQRTDALSAISLVELIARLTTVGVFGVIFAAFAEIGRPELTFTCNAGVALLAFFVLFAARFPPEGARREIEVVESVMEDDDVVSG